MPLVIEVLVSWLVLSPVVAVVLAAVIARAGRIAEARESLVELVPDAPPAPSAVAHLLEGTSTAVPRQDDVLLLRLSR